ncbi:MAG TPA: hypothetical protein DCQ93_03955 [Bacteroidetes bacterium]|nr:hypothetical protein [Bacteroidota bacterium]
MTSESELIFEIVEKNTGTNRENWIWKQDFLPVSNHNDYMAPRIYLFMLIRYSIKSITEIANTVLFKDKNTIHMLAYIKETANQKIKRIECETDFANKIRKIARQQIS